MVTAPLVPAAGRLLAAAAVAVAATAVGQAAATPARDTAAERQAVADAAARIDAKEPIRAIATVEAVIDDIEQRANRYHPDLAAPLLVLGDALAEVGDTAGAFGAYGRALHVTRVNHGLHHPSQVAAVYRQARLHAKQGDHAAANSRHEYAYDVLLRRYGGDDPALLPGLFALADWYLQNFNIFSARALYEHATTLAGERLGAAHPDRVRGLRSLAATYRSERFPPFYVRRERSPARSYAGFQYRVAGQSVNSFARGERALIEVVNIVQAQPDEPPEVLAQAMLELADWFLMFEKHRRAMSLYHRVWELLQHNPQLLARTFSAPTPLYLPLPRGPAMPAGGAAEAKQGVVELSIDVDEKGLVSRLSTVRSEPEDLMDFKVRRAVRRARYRPTFDGEASKATEDVRVKHSFVYYNTAEGPAERPSPAQRRIGATERAERLSATSRAAVASEGGP